LDSSFFYCDIKIFFFVIVYKSYHFSWSSLLSFLLPLVLLVSHLDLASLSSFFLITLPLEVQNPQALAHLEGLNFYLSFYYQDPKWVIFHKY
jgi:hypothetical protein